MDIVIGSESSIATPPAGMATLFVNTDKNNILYLKYPDGSFVPYNGSSDDCSCDMAKAWMDRVTCALAAGLITAAQFGTIMDQGVSVVTNTTTDADGNVTNTVTAGSRNIALTGFDVDDTTVDVTVGSPTHQIVPEFTPSNASNRGVDYVSSDPTKATVSSTGLITRVANGTTNISVIPQGGPEFTKLVVVTVAT